MHPGYARVIAATAYVWGWPIVNQFNRRTAMVAAPAQGLLDGILPAAPRGRITMRPSAIPRSSRRCSRLRGKQKRR